MGADAAILVSDCAFGGADTLATSYTLATTIKKIGVYDIIFCGKQAIDGDTAQVGPEIAEHLGIVQVTYVSKLEVDGNTVGVEREREDGYEALEVNLPVLVSVIKSLNYEPRYPTVKGTMKANRTEIPVWTPADFPVEEQRLGLRGSPTKVRRIFTPLRRTEGVVIQKDTVREAVAELLQKLSDAKIV
jgi:electron transfer flavoprotein beta subunit